MVFFFFLKLSFSVIQRNRLFQGLKFKDITELSQTLVPPTGDFTMFGFNEV